MSETANGVKVPGKYFALEREGQHVVVYADDALPDWFRIIARFPNKDRAEDYADMENFLLADFFDEDGMRHETKDMVAPVRELPKGAMAFISEAVRDALEKHRAPAEPAAHECTSMYNDGHSEPAAATEQEPHPYTWVPSQQPSPKQRGGARGLGPDGLSDQQRAVWKVIAEAISTTGLSPTLAMIGERAGARYPQTPIDRLIAGGYLRKSGVNLTAQFHVLKWPDGIEPRETIGRADGHAAPTVDTDAIVARAVAKNTSPAGPRVPDYADHDIDESDEDEIGAADDEIDIDLETPEPEPATTEEQSDSERLTAMAIKMLADGAAIGDVANLTGLSRAQVGTLQASIAS